MTAGRTVNSKNHDWCTPKKYVDAIHDLFGGNVALDPCSNQWSIVGADTEYALPERNGLLESWDFATVYVNPPYGADRERKTSIRHWLARCADAHEQYGAQVAALIPVATNTGHWKKYVWNRAAAICFLYDTRLRFLEQGEDVGKGAPMSCAMVYWHDHIDRFVEVFRDFGAVVDIRMSQQAVTTGGVNGPRQQNRVDRRHLESRHRLQQDQPGVQALLCRAAVQAPEGDGHGEVQQWV